MKLKILAGASLLWLGVGAASANMSMQTVEQKLLEQYQAAEKESGPPGHAAIKALWSLAGFYTDTMRLAESFQYYDKILNACSLGASIPEPPYNEYVLSFLLKTYETKNRQDRVALVQEMIANNQDFRDNKENHLLKRYQLTEKGSGSQFKSAKQAVWELVR
jgi:hypothetical protein